MIRASGAFCGVVAMLLLFAPVATAGDFDWVRDFNIRARSDSAVFKARLADRFGAGDAQVSAVLNDVTKPSDAYIVFRLEEMSGQPLDRVMAEYEFCRKRGWEAIAKRLGINPGSREFRKLKAGQDLYGGDGHAKGNGRGSGKRTE